MFQFDDNFLQSIGMGHVPEEQRQDLLNYIKSELELRVGTRLSEDLTNEQLAEFEGFIDGDRNGIHGWLNENVPNYQNDEVFSKLKASKPAGTPEVAILAEFASLMWLQKNRPDYPKVVREVMIQLKKEIEENKDLLA